MAAPIRPIAVSPVLREAVALRFEELDRTKSTFRQRYSMDTVGEVAAGDVLQRLKSLVEKVKELDPDLEQDDCFSTIPRYLEQAENDRSVSQAKLLSMEKSVIDKLQKHANRLEVSALHVELLNEVLNDSKSNPAAVASSLQKISMEDEYDFELVEGELEDVLDTFERHAFSPKEIDTKALEDYLDALFDNTPAKDELRYLRNDMESHGDDLLSGTGNEIDEAMVTWCINDLLKNPLIGEDKKRVLESYLESPLVLRELKSMLNSKSVKHWNWRQADKGLVVTARQNSEGKHCITVEEDIVDMLYLNCIAASWSMQLRSCLKEAVCSKGVWPGNNLLTRNELEKRNYYLLPPKPPKLPPCMSHVPPPPPIAIASGSRRRSRSRSRSPLPPPPPPPAFKSGKKGRKGHFFPPPPPPLPGTPNINDERFSDFIREFFVPRLLRRDGSTPENKSSNDTQAALLKALATEARLRIGLDGSAHGLAATFNSLAASLPHQTILTVLKFLGMPSPWLGMFKRFLAAPLNMGPIVRGTSDQILTRQCGVPAGHGLEALFSEAVMFFLDVVVHRKTGAYLCRLRDTCYFVGTEQQRNDAATEIEKFASVMGLDEVLNIVPNLLNEPIGFVNLTVLEKGEENSLQFDIELAKVEAYARRVKKQLIACSTVIEWIRTWNALVGTYADHLFAPLANVFGKAHLDAVTNAYNVMLAMILDGGGLTEHVEQLICTHLGHSLPNPPFVIEALLYFPVAYGGLGVKNPYITLNLARGLLADPADEVKRFTDAEQKYYDSAKEHFYAATVAEREAKLAANFDNDVERIAAVLGHGVDPHVFPPLAAITGLRERAAYLFLPAMPRPAPPKYVPLPSLIPAYNRLLSEPRDFMPGVDRVLDEVRRLSRGNGGDMKRWYQIPEQEQWALQLYGDECFEHYGGFEIWLGDSVPRHLVKLVRGEKVEDEEEDIISVDSDVDEV